MIPLFIDPCASYSRHAEALESRVGDETVILHLDRGIYFGLDAIGTVIWERLQAGETPEALIEYVRVNFEGVSDAVDADILEFLGQLLDNALIERR